MNTLSREKDQKLFEQYALYSEELQNTDATFKNENVMSIREFEEFSDNPDSDEETIVNAIHQLCDE